MRKVSLFGPSVGRQAGSRTIERRAALDRAVEGLHHDPRADSVQPAAVELGLAQDVEPERGVAKQRGSLRLR